MMMWMNVEKLERTSRSQFYTQSPRNSNKPDRKRSAYTINIFLFFLSECLRYLKVFLEKSNAV